MWLVILGILLNVAPIVANTGMPVHGPKFTETVKHQPATRGDELHALDDHYAIGGGEVSVGDGVMVAGFVLVVVKHRRSKR